MRLLTLLTLIALPLTATAQEGPRGIAFVQAPEQSFGVGFGATPVEAFAQATAQCVAGGAEAADCLPTTWCQPMGWSIDLFVQHAEGPHWHETHCGLPDHATAQAVAAALCDRQSRPYLIECALVQIYDWDGAPQM